MFKHTLTDYVSEGSTKEEILIKYIANEKYNVIPEKILPNENIIETLRKYEHDGTEITLQELYDVKKKFPLYSEEREIIGKFVKKKFFDTIILKVSKFFKLSEIPKDKLEYLIADIFGMDDKSFKLSTRLSIREIVAYGIKKGYLQNIH
uniref:Restriction endonuclease n=1 Tax=Parastrongyloides trichosuri TaxID=131310 RepID=A0A0N4ZUB3_PARTI